MEETNQKDYTTYVEFERDFWNIMDKEHLLIFK